MGEGYQDRWDVTAACSYLVMTFNGCDNWYGAAVNTFHFQRAVFHMTVVFWPIYAVYLRYAGE